MSKVPFAVEISPVFFASFLRDRVVTLRGGCGVKLSPEMIGCVEAAILP